MNAIEMEAKIKELEERIADLPDWKKKYEEEHSKLVAIRDGFMKLFDSPLLLPSYGTGPEQHINLKEQQLVVNLSHEEKPVEMTTSTNVGKILFIALTVFGNTINKDFTSAELTAALLEHGWNIGPNTLSPTVGGMVKDGYLMRLPDTKPTRFRTPLKVQFKVEKG